MADGSGAAARVLGLKGFLVVAAEEIDGELAVIVETEADQAWCPLCGRPAASKGRSLCRVRDVPAGGRPVQLGWKKRRWRCEEASCPKGSWTEVARAIPTRSSLTARARRDIVVRVGRKAHPVADVARDYGIGWATAMRVVVPRDAGTY